MVKQKYATPPPAQARGNMPARLAPILTGPPVKIRARKIVSKLSAPLTLARRRGSETKARPEQRARGRTTYRRPEITRARVLRPPPG